MSDLALSPSINALNQTRIKSFPTHTKHTHQRYNAAYQRREEMSYHRDWAKSRGDFTEARRLESELVAVESVRVGYRVSLACPVDGSLCALLDWIGSVCNPGGPTPGGFT